MSHFVAYILQFQEIIVYKIPPGGGGGSIASLRSIPVTLKHLKPKVISQKIVHEKLTQKQEKQKYFYDKSKRNLNELRPGDTIRVQSEKKWEPGVVVQKADTPRSYHV